MRCLNPIPICVGNDEFGKVYMRVPCGKCINCKSTKRSSWSTRMQLEQQDSNLTCFATLTYDDDHLPINYSEENGLVAVLKKDHIVKFLKRYRKSIDPIKLRYYVCGEYGETTHRPHYHFLFFFNDECNGELVAKEFGNLMLKFNSSWPYGSINDFQVAQSQGASMYAAKYVMKDFDKSLTAAAVAPPFSLKSQGLGRGFVESSKRYYSDGMNKLTVPLNGKDVPMPRYLRQKIYPRDTLTPREIYKLTLQMQDSDDERKERLKQNYFKLNPFKSDEDFELQYNQDLTEYLTEYYKKNKSKSKL